MREITIPKNKKLITGQRLWICDCISLLYVLLLHIQESTQRPVILN